jgi:hypothetical protein
LGVDVSGWFAGVVLYFFVCGWAGASIGQRIFAAHQEMPVLTENSIQTEALPFFS